MPRGAPGPSQRGLRGGRRAVGRRAPSGAEGGRQPWPAGAVRPGLPPWARGAGRVKGRGGRKDEGGWHRSPHCL